MKSANSNKNSKSNNRKKNVSTKRNTWAVILLFMVSAVVPLLVQLVHKSSGLAKYEWFSLNDDEYDFFLVYKMYVMIILSVIIIVALAACLYKEYGKYSEPLKGNAVIFGCYGVYLALALISSFTAANVSEAFFGGYAQYEPFPVLLGYGAVLLLAYLFVNNEAAIMLFLRMFIWGALIISFLGVLQFFAKDFFCTGTGKSLITMFSDIDASRISLSFEEGRVYMTLYNPNYVGSYVALILPVVIGGIAVMEKMWEKCLMGAAVIMLAICIAGSDSTTGKAAVLISVAGALIFCAARYCSIIYKSNRRRMLLIAGGTVAALIAACIILGVAVVNKISNYSEERGSHYLTGMELKGDKVVLRYKDTDMSVGYTINEAGNMLLDITDGKGMPVEFDYNEDIGMITAADDPFYQDIAFGGVEFDDGSKGLRVVCNETEHTFIYDEAEGMYYYNAYGKKTKDVVNSARIGFEGYEAFATNRGFLWSRSLPLMLNNILTGCGPDNFIYEFPNNDYAAMANNTYKNEVVTRPHSMYIQTGVQTGLISLLDILALYVVYFVQSAVSVWRCKKWTKPCIISAAVWWGSFGYMICGLFYDSTICVAPVYWAMLGIGLACNALLKKESVYNGKDS